MEKKIIRVETGDTKKHVETIMGSKKNNFFAAIFFPGSIFAAHYFLHYFFPWKGEFCFVRVDKLLRIILHC